MIRQHSLNLALIVAVSALGFPASADNHADLIQLLRSRSCRSCKLSDVDLMHADLRDAELEGAHLQRANLSQSKLDGADLRDSDLSFTSLRGASLRGADLRGSRLFGTDLRGSDLSGALLDDGALEQSHWDGAKGISRGARTHAGLHNAGVDASQAGRWHDAEQLFSAAIEAQPEEPLSWVARGLSRGEQGKNDMASRDLAHAGRLFGDQGDQVKADQLLAASRKVYESPDDPAAPKGNGVGSALLSGALSAAQALAPIALKALMPMIP